MKTNSKKWRKNLLALISRGKLESMGSGAEGTVYRVNSKYVVRVQYIGDEPMSSTNYHNWIMFVKANKKRFKCALPKIKAHFSDNNCMYTVIEVLQRNPYNHNDYDFLKYQSVESAAQLLLKDLRKEVKNGKQCFTLFKHLHRVYSDKFTLDLHAGNVMLRPAGHKKELVFTDPFYFHENHYEDYRSNYNSY